MIKKNTFKIIIIFLMMQSLAPALSLNESLIQSINNNLTLQIENSNLDIAEEDLFQSKANFLPTIALSGNISESETSDIKLQTGSVSADTELQSSSKSIILSQSIFNGFSKVYDLKSSKLNYELQQLNLKKSKQDVMLETIEAYFDTLIADKTYQSYQDNYNSVNERYIATKKEFEVGLASKTDVAQAESFMNSAKINMLNSKINFNKSINSFSDLIGTKAENMDFSKISVTLPRNFEEYKDLVQQNNLAIKMASISLGVRSAQVGFARSSLYPQVGLTASKTEFDESSSIVDSGTNDEIKATVTWPIFNSGKSLSTIRQAKEFQNSSQIMLQKTKIDTLTLASTIWEQSEIVRETIKAAELSLKASKTAYEGTKIEQEVGERSILDVLNSQQSLLNAEIQFFNQQKNQEVIKAQVLYMIGSLTLENLGEI
jgi:outer membrane protein